MTLPQWTPAPGYTKLGLRQIRDEFGCVPIILTPILTVPRPPLSPDYVPPVPITMAVFSVSPSALDETSNRIGTITYSIIGRDNLTVYARIYHISTSDADFVGAISWTINTDSGTLNFTVATDKITELSSETFQVAFTLENNNFNSSFFVSTVLTISDTSKYTEWNPSFVPVGTQAGTYVVTTGTPVTVGIINAKPGSTYTGTITYAGSGNPFANNPQPITTQTILADGTLYNAPVVYAAAGTYTYDITFSNFAPDTMLNGPTRRYILTVNQSVGNWRVSPVSTTVVGGNTLKFNWSVDRSDLTELSWYIVNPGTMVSYTGNGIPDRGTQFNIKRAVNTLSGDFTISTGVVTANNIFELKLFSGALSDSTPLAASGSITIVPLPPIPCITVLGDKTVSSNNVSILEWTVEGSVGEQVEITHIDQHASNPNYVIYFDYYPDAGEQFKLDNWGKATASEFVLEFHKRIGNRSGYLTSGQLEGLRKLGTRTVTLGEKLYSDDGQIKWKPSTGITDKLIPRKSPYIFSFVGNKAPCTKVEGIKVELTILHGFSLKVIGDTVYPYGFPIKPIISGPPDARVDFVGPTTGFTILNPAGKSDPDLRNGQIVGTGTQTWKFTSDKPCANNPLEWSAQIIDYKLEIAVKDAGYSGAIAAGTVKIYTDYQNKIIGGRYAESNSSTVLPNGRTNPVLVLLGSPGSTATWVADDKTESPDYTNTFSTATNVERGEMPVPTYLREYQTRSPGTVVFTITSPQSTNTLTLTVQTIKIDEQFYFSTPTGPSTVSPPEFSSFIADIITHRISGGLPNTFAKWNRKHIPLPGKTEETTQPQVIPIDASGNYTIQSIYPAPGTYNHTITLDATRKVLSPSIIVRDWEFTVTYINPTNTITISNQSYPMYTQNLPMMVRITSRPGDIVTLFTPTWLSAREVSGSQYQYVINGPGMWLWGNGGQGYHRGWTEQYSIEGYDPNDLIKPYALGLQLDPITEYRRLYPDIAAAFQSTDLERHRQHYREYGHVEHRSWPAYQPFPTRTITIPDNGVIEYNFNGTSTSTEIFVQSIHWDYSRSEPSYVTVGGRRYPDSGSFSRGITVLSFDPATLTLKSSMTFDSWGNPNGGRDANIAHLYSIPVGDLVIMLTYDASSIQIEMRPHIQAVLGGTYNDSWWRSRTASIDIGYAHQPSRHIYSASSRAYAPLTYKFDVFASTASLPYLGLYNTRPLVLSDINYLKYDDAQWNTYLGVFNTPTGTTRAALNYKTAVMSNFWNYRLQWLSNKFSVTKFTSHGIWCPTRMPESVVRPSYIDSRKCIKLLWEDTCPAPDNNNVPDVPGYDTGGGGLD